MRDPWRLEREYVPWQPRRCVLCWHPLPPEHWNPWHKECIDRTEGQR